MDLWIRSQDKSLLEKVIMVKVVNISEDNLTSWGIVVNNDYVFGEYLTEKRAKQVLEEINNLLIGKNVISFKSTSSFVDCKKISDMFDEPTIIETPNFEVKQLSNVIHYDMPDK